MASSKSKAKSVRLSNEIWAKLDWLKENENIAPNDFIREAVEERLERYAIPDLTVCEGQQELF